MSDRSDLYTLMIQIALKIGPVLYQQLVDLFGPKIPTWEELALENFNLQVEIDNAMK